jgi:hypothetical protein
VSRSSGATPSRRFACAGNATPSARRIANLDPNRARDREEIAVRANDQTAKQQAEQMAEMMKGGAGVTAQGAGMDLGEDALEAAGLSE